MEILGVERTQTLQRVSKKEIVPEVRLADTLTISNESQKRAEWVEKLKQMPDIRPEKIEAAKKFLKNAKFKDA